MLRFAIAVAMFACSHPAPAPAPPPPSPSGAADCAATAAHAARVLAAETTSVHEVEAAVDRHCRDDGWTADARTCITGAADHAAAHACAHDRLTGVQYDRVVADLTALMPHHDAAEPGSQAEIAARLVDEGKKRMYASDFAGASAKFREATERVPDPRSFFDLCTSLYQEGKFDEALSACRAAENNQPTPELYDKLEKLSALIKAEAAKQSVQLQHK